MKFEESGLPKNAKVEQAFDHAYGHLMAQKEALVNNETENLEAAYNRGIAQAQALANELTETDPEKANILRDRIEAAKQKHPENLKKIPEKVEAYLEGIFTRDTLGIALEISNYATAKKGKNALIAAALLCNSAKTNVDINDIEEKFGEAIAGLTIEISDLTESDREDLVGGKDLEQLSSDAKKIFLAISIVTLKNTPDNVKRQLEQIASQLGTTLDNLKVDLEFEEDQAKEYLKLLRSLRGLDTGLDARAVDLFNQVTASFNSPLKMQEQAGQLVLAGLSNPYDDAQKGPPPPPKNGSDGPQDVF